MSQNMQSDNSDNSAQSSVSDFNEAQRHEIAKIVIVALDHRRRDRNDDDDSVYNSSNSNNNSQSSADYNNNADEWKVKNVDFFDSDYDDDIVDNVDKSIKYFDKHIYYVDVYVFVDRLKNLVSLRDENKLRTVLSQCLRDYAQEWHSLILSELKKNLLRIASLVIWYQTLIKSFKKRAAQTLQSLQKKRYIMSDARQQRNSRMYAQNIFRHVRVVELESIFNQLILTWSNLDYEFRRDISESKSNTIIRIFLDQLKEKFDIWFDMTSQSASSSRSSNNNRSNKQDRRDRQNEFSQSSDEFNAFFFQAYRFVDYFVLAQQKQAYQKQSFAQSERRSVALSFAKQSLLLTSENTFDSKNQSRQQEEKSDDRDDKNFRRRVYVLNESEKKNDQKSIEKDFLIDETSESQSAYYSEDLVYYDFDHSDDSDHESTTSHFILSIVFICRRCIKSFVSNNKLHSHIRNSECSDSNAQLRKSFSNRQLNFFRKVEIDAVDSHVVTTSITKIIKSSSESDSSHDSISIVSSDVDFSKNIETDCEYRDWNYAKTDVALFEKTKSEFACIDTELEVTIANRRFFFRQNSDLSIRTMTTSLTVREIATDQHQTSEYVIASMYFLDQKNDKIVKIMIRREIHLMNNLKINMLIDNDVTDSEKWNIDNEHSKTTIDNCDVTIFIDIRRRSSTDQSMHKSVHIKKTIIVSSQSEMIISIHYLVDNISNDRDYLFESNETEFILYAHLMNIFIEAILVRNDDKQAVKISRNYRLDYLTELDYSNAFFVNDDNVDLTMKASRTTHKISWFKKIIVIFVTTLVVITVVVTSAQSVITAISLAIRIESISSLISASSVEVSSLSQAFDLRKSFTDQTFDLTERLKFSTTLITSSSNIVLSNDIIIYSSNDAEVFRNLIAEFSTLWTDSEFADLSEKNWMRISLRTDWENKISGKTKMYFLEAKDRVLVDKTFDELHDLDRLFWINESTSFSYSMFCVWKNVNEERKNRVVVDIRELNVITQSNVYSLSLQMKIISVVKNCLYITVVNAFVFFYQWRVHSDDRHKLTVVSHRDQKSFNVVVMKYKNSSVYVQRQIDRLLRAYRKFVKAYVDDIVIFSRIWQEHVNHLRQIFIKLISVNIFIKLTKAFIDYSSVQLLSQKVDSLDLFTSEKKLRVIAKLQFSRTLRQLKTYLDFTDWMRKYVSFYVDVFKPLQKRKTILLKSALKKESAKKTFVSRIKIDNSISRERVSYEILQSLLSKFSYFIHHDPKRQIYVNLNASKEFDIDVVVYHVKKDSIKSGEYSVRSFIQSIMFLFKLLNSIETRYWSTEMKVADIVWILRKIRHLIESFTSSIVIYTDHDATLDIVKQTTLSFSSTNKLNFRLVRVSDYIQRFDLNIRHKSSKSHLVSNVLSRLASLNDSQTSSKEEFDALFTFVDVDTDHSDVDVYFTCSLVKMNETFRQKILDDYKVDASWKRILSVLSIENDVNLSFERENHELIFRVDDSIDDHAFISRRLCISNAVVKDVLKIVHEDSNDHSEYAKCYEQIASTWYIRDLTRQLRDYLKYCSKCQINRIRRHQSHDSLQSILSSVIFFHTLSLDFILALSVSRVEQFNVAMSITCKFTKRVIIVLDKNIWTVVQWDRALLNQLDFDDWELSKMLISDRDRKFMRDF